MDCCLRSQGFVPWLSTWLTIDLASLTVDWQLLWEQTGEILFPDNTVPTFVIVSAITIIVIIIVDIITTSQHLHRHHNTINAPIIVHHGNTLIPRIAVVTSYCALSHKDFLEVLILKDRLEF